MGEVAVGEDAITHLAFREGGTAEVRFLGNRTVQITAYQLGIPECTEAESCIVHTDTLQQCPGEVCTVELHMPHIQIGQTAAGEVSLFAALIVIEQDVLGIHDFHIILGQYPHLGQVMFDDGLQRKSDHHFAVVAHIHIHDFRAFFQHGDEQFHIKGITDRGILKFRRRNDVGGLVVTLQCLKDRKIDEPIHLFAVGKERGGDTADGRGRCSFRRGFCLHHLPGLTLSEQEALGIGEVSCISGIVAALGVDQDAILQGFTNHQQAVGDAILHAHQVGVFVEKVVVVQEGLLEPGEVTVREVDDLLNLAFAGFKADFLSSEDRSCLHQHIPPCKDFRMSSTSCSWSVRVSWVASSMSMSDRSVL